MTALTNDRPRLTEAEIAELTAWRRELHRHPEVSGEEAGTAARVVGMLGGTSPDRIVGNLGGHGVAALYDSGVPGPRVLIRCELDALPIEETGACDWRSTVPGKGHLCGHDGHMAILAGLARMLGRWRPARGSVVLLFQPAEEDGSGAARVLADPGFSDLRPDYAFALHNYPGVPFGEVCLIEGPAFCASRGMHLRLIGRTAHASQPETGLSPMAAMAELMPRLAALGRGGLASDPDFALATVTHARLGAATFGVAPGEAVLHVTLRTLRDARMAGLVEAAEALVREVAGAAGLQAEIGYRDVFVTTGNAPEAVGIAARALERLNVPVGTGPLPVRPSEDFGRFGADAALAILLLGAGETLPALHNPDYDFPDALIPRGADIFLAILEELLGSGAMAG
ncbi:amidohydrolase [Frigidibacter sp. ROC022]|uniref:amidohydrolase n=1 Tax=Frigidibacter sp. ROC022 TaxID=2971796 RepID=UPI00215A48D9|nr:amidohydrolase [Frigidibacter sp. ROC022]MCR8725714.1 amidohydrolase [Frigidibacter sp. ROC022]